jgi:hypothetical protein
MHWDPVEASRLIEADSRINRSPFGLLIRSSAQTLIAVDRQDAQLVDAALKDLEYVRFFYSDNRVALLRSAYACTTAISIAEREGDDTDVVHCRELGKMVGAKLEEIKGFPQGDYYLWLLQRALGDNYAADRAISRLRHHFGVSSFFCAANALYDGMSQDERNSYREFVESANRERPYAGLAYAHLVHDCPGGAEVVRTMATRILDNEPNPMTCRYALYALALVDTSAEVQKAAERAQDVRRQESQTTSGVFGLARCVTYMADGDEPALKERVRGHAYSKCMAHFTIAMMRLADDKSEEAYKHFSDAVETNAIGSFDYELARAHKRRMEESGVIEHSD